MPSTPEQFQLPDRLLELSDNTQRIVNNAITFEQDINSCAVTYDRKRTLIQAAITDLDKQAMQVFFGQRVEIEGSYSYPIPISDGSDVVLKTIHEYGVRRGESLGFYGHLVEVGDEAEEANPDDLQAKFVHGVTLGTMVVQNSYLNLVGSARLQAPVTESGLSLCCVEDYKTLLAAESKVRQNQDEEKWTDTLDELLYSPEGPDLRELGETINQLRLVQGDKIHDYVTYINLVLRADIDVAAVLCDHLLDYVPERAMPVWISSPDLISGWNPTIGMADAYKMDKANNRVIKLHSKEPILTLRAMLAGSSEEHVLHIPLDAIQCSEFK